MKKNLITSVLMTIVTTVLLGIIYPLLVTVLANMFFHDQASGQLIVREGKTFGSRIIGQAFTADGYFHSRPSSAGTGYDAANSGASNYGPANHLLIERVRADVAKLQADNPGKPVPIDLITSSGSGLDPHITPAAAEFQVARVAKARGMSQWQIRALVTKHTQGRQFGFLGEPRVNVLELDLDLDDQSPRRSSSK